MQHFEIPFWKTAPFIRLLIPLIIGIILQWYFQMPLIIIIVSFASFASSYILFVFLPLSWRFQLQALQGILVHLLIICAGAFITFNKDIRNNQNWYGNNYKPGDYLLLRINDAVEEKNKSFKTEANVTSVIRKDSCIQSEGKLLLYFSKDSSAKELKYGDVIIIHKKLQSIKNSGNPGAFNYERYAAFQQLFHSAYLKPGDWILLKQKNSNAFTRFILSARTFVLNALRKNITGDNDELGFSEALLIGYKNDLDKDLVQAYSNTGVVHIIAISGLHLGLIYVMLLWIFNHLPFIKKKEWIKIIAVLSGLWLFALLTGAAASVLRSAVVFTCILFGSGLARKSSVYNSLAASAFILLCFNPYFLWDVGFQLSYCAILGIIIFQKHIYHLFYFKNVAVNKIWELLSVTLAAQVLVFPVCIYYFHQFPTIFLMTNLVIVPLATVVLYAEIFLTAISGIPFLSAFAGTIISWVIRQMNTFILWMNSRPFSVIDYLPASVISTWILYAIVIFTAAFLIHKKKHLFWLSLVFILCFTLQAFFQKWNTVHQKMIVVYNVPSLEAVDFISGKQFQFIGDSILREDALLQNFHLKPARILYQTKQRTDSIDGLFMKNSFCQFYNKHILILTHPFNTTALKDKIPLDALVLSKNAKVQIPQIVEAFNCRQIIADASNNLWKIEKWKKDCEKLNLRFHSVSEQGAFILQVED
jgi:competence protein ComEC